MLRFKCPYIYKLDGTYTLSILVCTYISEQCSVRLVLTLIDCIKKENVWSLHWFPLQSTIIVSDRCVREVELVVGCHKSDLLWSTVAMNLICHDRWLLSQMTGPIWLLEIFRIYIALQKFKTVVRCRVCSLVSEKKKPTVRMGNLCISLGKFASEIVYEIVCNTYSAAPCGRFSMCMSTYVFLSVYSRTCVCISP